MTFKETYVDFGKIKRGEKKYHEYSFTNTGDEDLILELVSGCHCSVIEEPIKKRFKPGEGEMIKVTFDSSKEKNEVTKTLDILLENINPETGYQMIYEVKYHAIIED